MIALEKKGGTKRIAKVHERIGRAKQKYPSVHQNYTIQTVHHAQEKNVVDLRWSKNQNKEEAKVERLGRYFLRTSPYITRKMNRLLHI